MSEPRLSPTTKALLEAARADVPSHASRTRMWTRVSGAAGGAASIAAATTAAAATGAAGASSGAGGTGGALVGGGASAAKLLALGALLGGTVTIGVAATLLHVGSMKSVTPRATAPVAAMVAPSPTSAAPAAKIADESAAHAPVAADRLAPGAAGDLEPVAVSGAFAEPAAAPSPAQVVHTPRTRPARRTESSSSLSLEASLITEARAALVNGDPLSALRKARAARALPARQLVPEELTVEAQALRALGRDGEASAIDQALRAQYPESALAR